MTYARPASEIPMIAYLVHDLNDAAVARRVEGFSAGGAQVIVAGFYRREAVETVSGAPAITLGQTHDARLGQRALLVAKAMVFRNALVKAIADCTIIVARNLEMLTLARSIAKKHQTIVYELLDIHRTLLGTGLLSTFVRNVEKKALRSTAATIVSSDAYRHKYLKAVQRHHGPVILVENKVSRGDAGANSPAKAQLQAPWRIGWFGMLRCRRSLDLLCEAAARSNGRIEVVLAGIPSLTEFEDFYGQVEHAEGVKFAGSYSTDELPELYSSVNFAWCIDFFEEGLNSAWLLPNRLYEALSHAVIPVALVGTQTGHWLGRAGVGLCLSVAEDIAGVMNSMDGSKLATLRKQISRLDPGTYAFSQSDHESLVRQLAAAG
ncbi:glycosyltransferase family protein [Qipengyuania seohaensis]|uniref:hypothetical protein n=1 Tax=Qipengyuania seohaensis TaxID=266951 RepID=UPI0012FDC007|nr:hypothetical protein [Qipengyuania seohaensis]